MEIAVTPATLSTVLLAHQPDASRTRATVGLFLIGFALIDLVATAGLGRGFTAALSGWLIRDAGAAPGLVVGLLVALIDGTAFLIGLGAIRGTRWQAHFKTGFREIFEQARLLAGGKIQPSGLVVPAISVAIGVAIATPLYFGNLANFQGPLVAALMATVVAAATILLAMGVLRTARLERHSVAAAVSALVILAILLAATTSPLATALTAVPDAGAAVAGWTCLTLILALAVLLFLGAETQDENLTLVLNWNPDSDPGLGSYFERNREEAKLVRRCVLRIVTGGRQLLVVTKHTDESTLRVVQTTALDRAHHIVLNDAGFAILDFRKIAENMAPTHARQAGPDGAITYSDADNLVSFDIKIIALPSTVSLPQNLTLEENTFAFLRDHIFASTVLSPLIDSILTTTVDQLVKKELGVETLADIRNDWNSAYHALDFADDVEALQLAHVLDRSPAMLESYRIKLNLGSTLERKIDDASARLEKLRPKLTAICRSLRSEFQSYVVREIDELIARNPNLSAAEKSTIQSIVKLFNITATATPTPQRELELDRMRQEAREVRAKLAADIKESKGEVRVAQTEVSEMIRTLLAKPMLTGAERRFLEGWSPRPTQTTTQISSAPPTALPPAGSPSPPASPPTGGSGFKRRRF